MAYETGSTSDLLINYALKENQMTLANIKPLQEVLWTPYLIIDKSQRI